jgi:hypothetical protein
VPPQYNGAADAVDECMLERVPLYARHGFTIALCLTNDVDMGIDLLNIPAVQKWQILMKERTSNMWLLGTDRLR